MLLFKNFTCVCFQDNSRPELKPVSWNTITGQNENPLCWALELEALSSHYPCFSGAHWHTRAQETEQKKPGREDSLPSHALIPYPVLHGWREWSPQSWPCPQSEQVRFISIQPQLHRTSTRQQRPLGHEILHFSSYMKMKSCKKKQTMPIWKPFTPGKFFRVPGLPDVREWGREDEGGESGE